MRTAKPQARAQVAKLAKLAKLAKSPKSTKSARSASKPVRAAKVKQYVYFFANGKADGNRNMKDVLGGKGAGLAEMTNAGLPVPPGFTISTAVCNIYYEQHARIPAAIDREIDEHLKRLETAAGAKLGSTDHPLLVSVRSGAKFSMPGMMDTSRSTATAASSRCSATSSSRFRRMRSSTNSTP